MTDHLPECDYERQDYRGNDNRVCYCSRLRACEQRVNSSNLTMWNRTQEQAQHMIDSGLGTAWKDGFKEGLDAAEAAVAQAPRHYWVGWAIEVDVALAAIRALKEKP